MNEKIFEQLEYTRIKDTIASFCVSEDRRNAFTEIKPISDDKKIDNESALNNFREYTMIDSKQFAPYFGFTEDEVLMLCKQYDMNFDGLKEDIMKILEGGKGFADIVMIPRADIKNKPAMVIELKHGTPAETAITQRKPLTYSLRLMDN